MDLLRWMVDNGVQLSKKVQLGTSDHGGSGVFARSPIKNGTVILQVPKSAVLSPRTAGIANLLDDNDDLNPMLQLVAAYYFEKSQGAASPWHQFISFLEKTELPELPRFWSAEEKALLQDSDLELLGGLSLEDVEDGFQEVREFFSSNNLRAPDLDEFSRIAIIVSSRAFHVDNFHDLSLVPGACWFNHSSYEHVHFETDGSVCDLCGKVYCECREISAGEQEKGEEHDDVDGRIEHDANIQGDMADEDEAEKENEKENEEENINDDDDDDDDDEVAELSVVRAIRAGEEIFNTYGEESNSYLLAKYGFVLPKNRHDVVLLTTEIHNFVGRHGLETRLRLWEKLMRAKHGDDDLSLVFIDHKGVPSTALKLLLQVFALNKRGERLLKTCGLVRANKERARHVLRDLLSSRHQRARSTTLLAQVFYASKQGHEAVVMPYLKDQFRSIKLAMYRTSS